MSVLPLSNLRLRSNLLANDYQDEMYRCSVFEIRDIWGRNQHLRDPGRLSRGQEKELERSLFWGRGEISLADGGRQTAWLRSLATRLDDAVHRLEEQPALEHAVEILIVARQLYRDVRAEDSQARRQVIDWDRRVCAVLARDEFRLTPQEIADRLENIVGEPLPMPEPALKAPASLPEPATATVPTSRREPIEARPPSLTKPTVVGRGGHTFPASVLVTAPSSELMPPTSELAAPQAIAMPAHVVTASAERSRRVGPQPGASAARIPPAAEADRDLARLARRWPTLPEATKKCILMLVEAADLTQRSGNN